MRANSARKLLGGTEGVNVYSNVELLAPRLKYGNKIVQNLLLSRFFTICSFGHPVHFFTL